MRRSRTPTSRSSGRQRDQKPRVSFDAEGMPSLDRAFRPSADWELPAVADILSASGKLPIMPNSC